MVLASSAQAWQVEHYLDLLGARDLVDGWTSADDVDAHQAGPGPGGGGAGEGRRRARRDDRRLHLGLRVGRRAGIETIAVLTGGFSREELLEAGAIAVHDSLDSLIEMLRTNRA